MARPLVADFGPGGNAEHDGGYWRFVFAGGRCGGGADAPHRCKLPLAQGLFAARPGCGSQGFADQIAAERLVRPKKCVKKHNFYWEK